MTTFELSLRKYVLEALKPLDACAAENSACPGFPDVEFMSGTMELKVLKELPVRPTTVVKLPKFRPLQRNWLRKRWRAGGLALFLLRVERQHFLFDGEWAADHLGVDAVTDDLYLNALAHWGPTSWSRKALYYKIRGYYGFTRYVKGKSCS
jgi:hypothetical protein